MKKLSFFVLLFIFSTNVFVAQTSNQPAAQKTLAGNQNVFDLSQYGVSLQPDERLIVVMAALEAAGFEFQLNQDSPFRQTVRRDLQNLDPDLKRRLGEFFARNNKNYQNASPTEQISRYVSLVYALGPAPGFSAPARSADLPAGLLEVLDFAPLVAEFYQKSGIAQKLPEYAKEYQTYADKLRPSIIKVVRETSAYLNTRPQLGFLEKIATPIGQTSKNDKKSVQPKIQTRERTRQFFVVPDLLAVPNTVKFRNIGDNYYAIIGFFDFENAARKPEQSSELRRAYLQFLIDPLIYKNAKEISAQREAIRSLLSERAAGGEGAAVTPDVYLAIARSLVVAAEIRERKLKRIEQATEAARSKMGASQQSSGGNNSGKIVQITDEVSLANNRLTFPKAEAEAFAELSEAYENGAVFAFFFDDQLRGLESAGFDIASSFAEMLTSFDVNKEKARLKETETARRQALALLAEQRKNSASQASNETETPVDPRRAQLNSNLKEIAALLQNNDYETAEKRLLNLLSEFPGNAQIFFALGQTASFSAQKAFDENLRDERLKKAVVHYRNAIAAANGDSLLLLQTHVALGKIYEFYDENEAALKEFEAAVALGKVEVKAYNEALNGKQRLGKK